jgi:hypothetical protein
MKTYFSVVILTIAFLSAGAFAKNDLLVPSHKANITVVFKNQSWPVKGQITIDACKINRCREA